jgi:hypothetical protein
MNMPRQINDVPHGFPADLQCSEWARVRLVALANSATYPKIRSAAPLTAHIQNFSLVSTSI